MNKSAMNKILFLITVVLVFLSGCTQYEAARIEDLRRPVAIALTRPPADGRTYHVVVNGHGYIDGQAVITLVLDGEDAQEKTLRGLVNFTFFGEWKGGRADLRYVPNELKSGMLNLRYRFVVADDE